MASIQTLEAKAAEYERRIAAVEQVVGSHAGEWCLSSSKLASCCLRCLVLKWKQTLCRAF